MQIHDSVTAYSESMVYYENSDALLDIVCVALLQGLSFWSLAPFLARLGVRLCMALHGGRGSVKLEGGHFDAHQLLIVGDSACLSPSCSSNDMQGKQVVFPGLAFSCRWTLFPVLKKLQPLIWAELWVGHDILKETVKLLQQRMSSTDHPG